MADNVSPETRRRTMRAVSGRNSRVETRLRRALWAGGQRGYRIAPAGVPGHPDIVFTAQQLAIFVDGCFWHGCPEHCRRPSSNTDYWRTKIARNMARDARITDELHNAGWHVLRVWEHEVRRALPEVVERIARLRRDRGFVPAMSPSPSPPHRPAWPTGSAPARCST